MSQDLGLAILEKNLEGTLSDLASAGTLTLYWFYEPLAKSHTSIGLMDPAVLREQSLVRPQTSPYLHLPQPQPLENWLSSETKHQVIF